MMADLSGYSEGDVTRLDKSDDANKSIDPLDDAIQAFREQVVTSAKDKFAEGDVVRWIGGGYRYAAIKAGGRWWITGTGNWYGTHVFDYEGLIKALNRSDVTGVAVATTWREI